MSEKSKMLFQFLTVCGTLCILGSLGGLLYVYQQNSALLGVTVPGEIPKAALFFAFVVVPSALTFLAGVGMVIVGIRIGMKDNSP